MPIEYIGKAATCDTQIKPGEWWIGWENPRCRCHVCGTNNEVRVAKEGPSGFKCVGCDQTFTVELKPIDG